MEVIPDQGEFSQIAGPRRRVARESRSRPKKPCSPSFPSAPKPTTNERQTNVSEPGPEALNHAPGWKDEPRQKPDDYLFHGPDEFVPVVDCPGRFDQYGRAAVPFLEGFDPHR